MFEKKLPTMIRYILYQNKYLTSTYLKLNKIKQKYNCNVIHLAIKNNRTHLTSQNLWLNQQEKCQKNRESRICQAIMLSPSPIIWLLSKVKITADYNVALRKSQQQQQPEPMKPLKIQNFMSSPAFLETDYLIMIFVIQSSRSQHSYIYTTHHSCEVEWPRIGAFLEVI